MISRRDFIIHSSVAAAGLMVPGALMGAESPSGKRGTDEKIRVGLIGCRSMGWGDYVEFLHFPEAECTALCDIDRNVLESRAAELEKITGNKPKTYSDYRKMLEDKDIDAVVIGTPDHWHCLMTCDACAAGKDVYVEKPLANSIAECDAMVAFAEHYKRVVQVGQQQRSGLIWHEMKKYLDTGSLGRIAKVNVWGNFSYASILRPAQDSNPPEGVDFDMWLGPAPMRSFNGSRFHGSWRMFWDYGGGLVTDWGVHLLDMALWGTNTTKLPRRVMATGGNFAYPTNYAETFDTLSVLWEYEDLTIQWNNVAAAEVGPYGKNYGLEFIGTEGVLVANREGWDVIPKPGSKLEPASFRPDDKDRTNHVGNFLECIRTRNLEPACTIRNGSLCAKFAHLGNIAARTRSCLVYDDVRKTFGNSEADRLLKPAYRAPWTFPEIPAKKKNK